MLAHGRGMIYGTQTIRPRPRLRLVRLAALAGAWYVATTCSANRPPQTPAAHTPAAQTTITMARVVPGRDLFVVPNPHNALSTVVTFDARGFDSARVVYWGPGEPARATPFSRVRGVGRVVTLGLRPETPYFHVLERVRGDDVITSDTVQ